jgi:hypothetical protein
MVLEQLLFRLEEWIRWVLGHDLYEHLAPQTIGHDLLGVRR